MSELELPQSPFDELVGTEWISDDPDDARCRVAIRDELRQPVGLLHGGVIHTLIESLCSRATAIAVVPERRVPVGQGINVNLLRPVTEGGIEVRAQAVHRGRTTWVWQARVEDFEGRLAALGQMTMAVRELDGKIRAPGLPDPPSGD